MHQAKHLQGSGWMGKDGPTLQTHLAALPCTAGCRMSGSAWAEPAPLWLTTYQAATLMGASH